MTIEIDLLGVLRVEAHRPGVDVPKRLKRAALPSMTGRAASGADVAQAEHCGAVGDDGHGVAFDRVLAGEERSRAIFLHTRATPGV